MNKILISSMLLSALTQADTLSLATAPTSWSTHTVEVGMDDGYFFAPAQLDAQVGDVVFFRFHGSNHSVVESTFQDPCTKLPSAFDSGTGHFTPNEEEDIVALTVTSRAPRWFFCAQQFPVSHCAQGMVFALNSGSQTDPFPNSTRDSITAISSGYTLSSTSSSALQGSRTMATTTTMTTTTTTCAEIHSETPHVSSDSIVMTYSSVPAALTSAASTSNWTMASGSFVLWPNNTINATGSNATASYVTRSTGPPIIPVNKSGSWTSTAAVWVLVRMYLCMSLVWVRIM